MNATSLRSRANMRNSTKNPNDVSLLILSANFEVERLNEGEALLALDWANAHAESWRNHARIHPAFKCDVADQIQDLAVSLSAYFAEAAKRIQAHIAGNLSSHDEREFVTC